jgi:hypothetical protein
MTWLLCRSAWHDVGGTNTPEWRRLDMRKGLEHDEQWRPEGHQDTRMSSTRNTFPIVWNRLLRAIWMTVLVCVSACTAIDRPRSPLSDARISGGTRRPALDRILSQGEVQVAEGHVRDFGYDPGPVYELFTAQTQAAIRAFQTRYGLPVTGLLRRETRLELLPGLDQDEIDDP